MVWRTRSRYTPEEFAAGFKKSLTSGTWSAVAMLNTGLEDTLAYYMVEEFVAGFKKTLAFQLRVTKQNRGSSGTGIYCWPLPVIRSGVMHRRRGVGSDDPDSGYPESLGK